MRTHRIAAPPRRGAMARMLAGTVAVLAIAACEPGRPDIPLVPPTPTPSPVPGFLVVTGKVFDAAGPDRVLPDAVVSAVACDQVRLPADVGEDGRYVLGLPPGAVDDCREVQIEARAPGFGSARITVPLTDTRRTRWDIFLRPISESADGAGSKPPRQG